MYPPEQNTPAAAVAGDTIEHKLMPGFPMTVQEAAECETDGARPEPHSKYRITDPDGNEDWLCGYDVVNTGQTAGHTAMLTTSPAQD